MYIIITYLATRAAICRFSFAFAKGYVLEALAKTFFRNITGDEYFLTFYDVMVISENQSH